MSPVLPDADRTNWVDRHAPEPLRPWLKLGRFDRPAGIWLLMLPGWMGIALAGAMQGRGPDLKWLALFALGAGLMRAAGCAYNDIVDRDIDAQVARTAGRPIPAGQISVRQAWVFVLSCCAAAFGILILMPPVAIALGVGSLALVAAYPFMKRITWWPQAWLGLTFNWGALMGFAAVTATVQTPALILYAALVFWTLGYDTLYALQDLEDDALAGVKSSARRLGAHTQAGVLGFYAASFVLLLIAAAAAGLGPLFLPLAGLYGVHLSRQAAAVRLDDAAGALRLFRSNRDAGLLAFAAMSAGLWRAAPALGL